MSRKPGASVSVCNVQSDLEWTDLCERQVEIRVVVIGVFHGVAGVAAATPGLS